MLTGPHMNYLILTFKMNLGEELNIGSCGLHILHNAFWLEIEHSLSSLY